MEAIYALTIVLIIFAIGDFCSAKTSAILSLPFVAAILLLLYYWLGFPKTLVADAGLNVLGSVASGVIIAGVGTTIDFKELARQWKTIVISVISVLAGVAGIILIGSLIIGREQAMAGAPIFSGSISAVIIMSDFFNLKGLQHLSALCSMLLTVQTFVGLPLSTIMMRKASSDFLKSPENIKLYSKKSADSTDAEKKLFNLPASMSTSIIILAKLALTASLANMLAALTGGLIHYLVMALFLGLILTRLGLLDENSMNKSGCSGFFMVLILASLFSNFSFITPQDVMNMLLAIVVVLGIGSIFTSICAVIMAKFMNMNPFLAIALGLTCMYGFPTTLFISQDVAKSYGKTEEEHTALSNYLVPKVVTAGIATVTIASVIIASFTIKFF